MSAEQASVSLSALPGHGWTADEEESFLRDTEEVAQSFVSLVLGQERGVEKSPASGKLAADGAHTAAPSRATQIATKLKTIGDDFDARVRKEIDEVAMELLRDLSIYQLGMEHFNHMCHRVLSSCSDQMKSGWDQMTAVYMVTVQTVRQLQSTAEAQEMVRPRQQLLQSFTGQYMRNIGLETWVQNHGGLDTLLQPTFPGEELDTVPISDNEL